MFGCFNYPPPAALAYAALAWLPLGKAAVLHAYLSIAAALATAWLLAIAVRRRDLAVPFAIILFVFPAFFINLSLNQNAVFTTLVIAAAWCLFDRKRDLAAGLVLSLLICKPNWLIAVGWIPLVHRRWRALAGIALGSLAITAISALALGTKSFADYYEVFRQVARLQNVPGYFLDVKYSGVALFRKWWGSTSTADLAGWLTSVMLIAATWAITRRAWRPGTPNMRTTLAAAFAAALWINPHLNYYDLFPLALCVGVMLVDWTTSVPRMKITAAAGVLLALLAIPWDLMWNWNRVAPVPTIAILVVWVWFAYVSAKTGEAEAPTSAGLPISRSAPSIAGTTS